MSYSPPLNKLQNYLAAGQLTATAPPNTRRCTMAFGSGSNTATAPTGYQDVACRMGFTLPVTPTRVRFKIRNSIVILNANTAQSVVITGGWWGTPNTSGETGWAGDFTAAPTSLSGLATFPVTQDIGTTQWVSNWVTPPATAVAGAFQGVSFGFTIATDAKVNTDLVPGWTWAGATGAGCAAAAGNAAVPIGTGTAYPWSMPFDIRMEYEFVGSNQIGLFLGTSVTAGWSAPQPPASTGVGAMGPANRWPDMAGSQHGHCVINAAIGGNNLPAVTASTTTLQWTRFDLGPNINSGVSCIPDYAVIELGINDLSNALSNIQSDMIALVATLKSIGIPRIFICTTPGGPTQTAIGGFGNLQAGSLSAQLAAGALGTVDVIGPLQSTTKQAGPGTGNPGGTLFSWWDSAGSFTVASCSASASATITTTANFNTGGADNGVQPGMMVTGTGIPSGTQVLTVNSSTSITVNQPVTVSSATLTFSPYGVYFDMPASTNAEGPFAVTNATGTTTLALTASGTTVNVHAFGSPVFTLNEGTRQALNFWVRNVVPGTVGVVDLSDATQAGRMGPAAGAITNPQVPLNQTRWDSYAMSGGAHPNGPSMHSAWARVFAASIAGT